MKAVSADAIFFIKFVRQCIRIGHLWKSGMKGGVETGDLFRVGQIVLGGADTGKVGRIVQRSQVSEIFDRSDHLIIDKNYVKPEFKGIKSRKDYELCNLEII